MVVLLPSAVLYTAIQCCLHTGSQHGDDHTGTLMESDVPGSADMTLTRKDVTSGGDNGMKVQAVVSEYKYTTPPMLLATVCT